jgi:hypothetical protein
MKIIDVPQSGSVGARTSSRNRSGQYVRQRAIPTQPRTPAQITVRAQFANNSSSWRGLTQTQRNSWTAFGNSFTINNSLGTPINLTGNQVYNKVNGALNASGNASVAVPPALPSFVPNTVTGVSGTAGTQLLELAGAAPASGTQNMIFVSPQVSAGVSFNGKFAYIGNTGTFASGQYAITTLYQAKYGTLVAGKKVFVKMVQSQGGMQDNGTIFSCIIGT